MARPLLVFVNDEELTRRIAKQIADARDMAALSRLLRHQAIEMRQNKRDLAGAQETITVENRRFRSKPLVRFAMSVSVIEPNDACGALRSAPGQRKR